MTPKLIAIAGGTGAGKSSLAFALMDAYPDKISIVHLDDYQWHGVNRSNVPIYHGMRNWDHPDAIDWVSLIGDLEKLKAGKSITILSKNERLVPRTKKRLFDDPPRQRILMEIVPMPIIILEGYISLWHPRILSIIEYAIFLDAGHDLRASRRTGFLNPEYEKKVLIPAHESYVEPTKQFADVVIDVDTMSFDDVIKTVERDLFDR